MTNNILLSCRIHTQWALLVSSKYNNHCFAHQHFFIIYALSIVLHFNCTSIQWIRKYYVDRLSNPNSHILLYYIGGRHIYLLAYIVNHFVLLLFISFLIHLNASRKILCQSLYHNRSDYMFRCQGQQHRFRIVFLME